MNKNVKVSQIVMTAPNQRGIPKSILRAIAVPITSYMQCKYYELAWKSIFSRLKVKYII